MSGASVAQDIRSLNVSQGMRLATRAGRLALVKNPKTPTPLAQRLLPSLRKPDLQALAKSSNVREAIKAAALRLYLGKI